MIRGHDADNRQYMRIQFSAILISLGACLAFASETGTDAANSRSEVLDEVVVSGTRVRELRAAVIKAEDRLLARYNELSQDDDLDIECLQFTPTGTRMSYRYCLTKLQKHEQERYANDFLTRMRNSDVPTGGGTPISEVKLRLFERSEDYRENLLRLLQENPDLRELVGQRAEALRHYEAAVEKRWTARPR